MKFTDGNWMLQPGVRPHYATQARSIEKSERQLRIDVATRRVLHRGDTLDGPMLRFTLDSPFEDVIQVRMEHFRGRAEAVPQFQIACDESFRPIIDVAESAILTAGKLSAEVSSKNSWSLSFHAEGRRLTGGLARSAGFIQVEPARSFMMQRLSLAPGEVVYGLGERFTALVKNGQVVEIWNRDGGTGSDQAYKNVPFYLTNRGYGVFVRHPGKIDFEVASEHVADVQFSVEDESLEFFVIYGPTPKEVLAKYARLTGVCALPPAWSFGLWLSTSFTTDYDEKTVTGFIEGMANRDLPLRVFHFDCFWMRESHWCDFEWDPETFPDPKGMLARLKGRGVAISVWINPYVGQLSSLFDQGAKCGFFLKRPDGSVWQTDQWQPGMAVVDFTNSAAREWFVSKLDALIDAGVDAFKTDFGERIPTDVVYADGSDPIRSHNYYSYLYNQTVFEHLERRRGRGEAVVFARSATAGGQKFPVHWGGDCHSTFESMAESLRGGLSLGLSGFGFWSHDIGGFEGNPPADVYKRWLAFGLLSSHSRLHGSSSYRVPWLIDEESVDVLRLFTKLKCRLMPYLYGLAVESRDCGLPMMRAMMLEFPEDRTCDYLDRQYCLGDALVVAPIFDKADVAEWYLPAGKWTHLLDASTEEGGRWLKRSFGFLSLPLYQRPNTIVPLGAIDSRPDYEFQNEVTLRVAPMIDGAHATRSIVDLKGNIVATAHARRFGNELALEVVGDAPGIRWLLPNLPAPKSYSNCTVSVEKGSLVVFSGEAGGTATLVND